MKAPELKPIDPPPHPLGVAHMKTLKYLIKVIDDQGMTKGEAAHFTWSIVCDVMKHFDEGE